MTSRLHEKYRKEAVPALTKRFGYTNIDGRAARDESDASTSAWAKRART